MDWLSVLEFFGRYVLPPVIIIILATTRVMRVRYSLMLWGAIVVVDNLSAILIPHTGQWWPPTFTLVTVFLGHALEVTVIICFFLFVIRRSKRRRWKDMFSGCQAKKDLCHSQKENSPFVRLLLPSSLVDGGIFYPQLTKYQKVPKIEEILIKQKIIVLDCAMDIFRSEIKTYKKKVEQRLKIFLDKEKTSLLNIFFRL